MNPPKIAVIIPVCGAWPDLTACLDSALALDYPNFEIIVVDDGLTDSALSGLAKYKDRIKLLESGARGPSFARNLAAKHTDSELLAFTDSDCELDKNWLKELVKGLAAVEGAVSCGGRQELPTGATQFEHRVVNFLEKVGFLTDYIKDRRLEDIIETEHNPSCNVLYKRDVFLAVGGFLEGLWPGEDVELDWRLKSRWHNLVFNPRALVFHHRPKDWRSFRRMMYRYGWAQGFLVKRYGIFRKIQKMPIVVFSVFFIWMAVMIIFWPLGLALLALVLFAVYSYAGNPTVFSFLLSALAYWHVGFIQGIKK